MKHYRDNCTAHDMTFGGRCLNCGAEPPKAKTMTITGTCYFVSRAHAESYYAAYEGRNASKAVQRKLNKGEIHIGKPPLKDGETLCLCDEGRRYSVKSA